MPVLFGSPEAKAILAKDKELQRQAEEEAKRNSLGGIQQEIDRLEGELEEYQLIVDGIAQELNDLYEQRRVLRGEKES